MNWSLLFESYINVFTSWQVILMTLLGALGGVLLGAVPGMTATMGVALLIPFSFGMDLIPSIGLLLGIYCGGMYGGSISAILIHAPGTPSAAHVSKRSGGEGFINCYVLIILRRSVRRVSYDVLISFSSSNGYEIHEC